MTPPGPKRARSDEDKERRRQLILDSAAHVLEQTTLADMSMAHVAERAGVAKGTLYLYFVSKEELALELFERELAAGLAHLASRLDAEPGAGAQGFTGALVKVILDRPLFIRLAVKLHIILERNVSLERAVTFKMVLRRVLGGTGPSVERCIPFLEPGHGAQLLLRCFAVLIGVHQVAVPPPVSALANLEPGLEMFQMDFASELCDTLLSVIRGMELRYRNQRPSND